MLRTLYEAWTIKTSTVRASVLNPRTEVKGAALPVERKDTGRETAERRAAAEEMVVGMAVGMAVGTAGMVEAVTGER